MNAPAGARVRRVDVFLIALVAVLGFPGCETPTNPVRSTPGSPLAVDVRPAAAPPVPWICVATRSTALPAAECPVMAIRPVVQPVVAGSAASADIPRNLSFSVSGTTVNLGWQPSASGVLPSSYVVQAGSATTAVNVADYDTGSAALTFSAANVPAGIYFVRILANYYGTRSGPSNEVVISVAGGPSPCALRPNSPARLAGVVDGSSVTLTWDAPAGCTAADYFVEAGSATGLVNLANFNTGSAATGLRANDVGAGTYFVRIRARNAAGISEPSNELVIVVGASCAAAPGVPGFLGWTTAGAAGALQLFWEAGTGVAASYVVELGTTLGATNVGVVETGSATRSYAATGLPAGDYYARVRAKNPCGISAPSNEARPRVG